MKVIADRSINYPLTVVVMVISFVLFEFLFWLADFNYRDKIWASISLVCALIIAYGDKHTVPILTQKEVLFAGIETNVWVGPGTYFLFYLFTFAEAQTQSQTRGDTVVTVEAQDQNGKVIKAEANGDWAIDNPDAYEVQDPEKMVTNLQSLCKRTLIIAIGKKIYKTHILGNDLGEEMLADPIFLKECRKYGIKFKNMIAHGVALDLKQENLNSYAEELRSKAKASYGQTHVFTHDELKEIEADVQVQVGVAKRLISSSPVLTRADIAL